MRYLIFFILLSTINITAQMVRINEMVSSNSVYIDEDGDTPDWLELHNYGTQEVSLDGWFLSDDEDDLTKWTFPNITLSPDGYLMLWASSKDRSNISYSRTLINQGDAFKYLIPTTEPSSDWKAIDFDDSTWTDGSSGFGYNDDDDETIIPNGTLSVYLRKTFTISNLDNVSSVILDMDYDDAFVAYINGEEVARANINGVPPAFNSSTIQDHEAQLYSGGIPERFLITDFITLLNEGDNILTIQAHNISSGSSDFTIIPFLSAVFLSPTNAGIEPPIILGLTTNNLHTNFKISSGLETLNLSNPSETIVHQITAEDLPPNTSIGVSVSSGAMVHYLETSPGFVNSSNEYLGIVQSELIFSHEGGLVDGPINLILSGNTSTEVIRYAIGGEEPTESSELYSNPIQLNENTTIRAQIFLENYLPSPVYTKSYITNATHEIDLMLLSTAPDNFFDEDTGIYVFGPDGTYDPIMPYFGANFWEDWERPVHFSFHENATDNFAEFNAGIKIFGGWSRGQNDQRSLSLFARGQYGDSKFKHAFFNQLTYDKFQALVLRNSGQDWMRSSMKDIMLTSLMRGSGLDFQEHNPVATYINSEYWGMYNLREKINEHMLASKHNIDAEDITLLTNNAEEIEGSNEEYNQLINYISATDLSIDSNFEYIEQQIDLKEYALYQASNIFFNNTDWPGNNIKFWKHPAGKWRWIMYDTDFGFGPFWMPDNYDQNTLSFALYPNGTEWPNPSWSTLLFRNLITNIGFRNRFINRYADELNSRFLPDNIKNHIDHIYSTIEPEINAHYQRWGSDSSAVDYYVNMMKNFADNRPSIVKDHIMIQFNLPNFHPLTITNINVSQGSVKLNENLNIQESSWTGDYFETVPIQLTAIAANGFEFSYWSGDLSSTDETISISLVESFEVVPNFTPSQTNDPIVINEINYKSSDDFNADDWVELYNPNTTTIDISDWQLKDDDDSHVFTIPSSTSITADGYLVIVKDASDFSTVFPDITNYIGEIGFGFGNSDSVRLFNSSNVLQDEVIYTSNDPWPDCAKETGDTLELIIPNLDNSLPESWNCINTNGSPNAINSNPLSLEEVSTTTIKIYPNPVQNILYISGVIDLFTVQVYTVTGQKVFEYSSDKKLDVSHLTQGIYFIKINEGQKSSFFNFIKH
tara:strand:+ start:186 stop:3650 length:3465 start_codon:yes stop_codon:yes gene_type:complete